MFNRELRGQIRALASRWMATGKSRGTLARSLGMNDRTLASWCEKRPSHGAILRPITVRDGEPSPPIMPTVTAKPATPPDQSGGAVVVLPSGIRIEGLTLPALVELVRGVS